MSQLKTIIVCADDFGYSKEVSEGIIQLGTQQRLSSTSCMVNRPAFLECIPALLSLPKTIQIGLHFNLTDGFFISDPNKPCFGLNELLIKSYLGLLSFELIQREFQAQLDRFVQAVGRMPDFIDGHQHVHQMPVIRRVLLQGYTPELKAYGTYYRATSNLNDSLKSIVISVLGGHTFYRLLNKANIPHNDSFFGVYDFNPSLNYRNLFRHWLMKSDTGTLIMCHPSAGLTPGDGIAQARLNEFHYLMSDAFGEDLNALDCQLAGVNDKPKIAH